MSTPPDKGSFSSSISEDVIQEALKSVDRAKSKPEGVEVDVAPVEAAAPAAGDQAAPAEPQSPLQKELELVSQQLAFSQHKGRELMEKLREEHERALRSQADLENYRKRALKEREEVQKFGAEKLLRDFLPVVDNLDRALEHAKSASDFDSLKQGIQMTRKLFEDTLGRHGVKSFSAVGLPFDPHLHEAMQQVERADLAPNQVVMEVARGYMLHDRLVRPAMVAVSKAPESAAAATEVSSEPSSGDGGAAAS